jgi:hypothetical protein
MEESANVQPARVVRITTAKGDTIYYGPYVDAEEAVQKANNLIDEFRASDSLDGQSNPPVGYQIFYMNVPKED